MKKHVLYLSYDGMTDPLGQSQVLSYLKELTQYDFVFHLISFEKKDRWEAHGTFIQDFCDEAKIHWYPQSYRKNPPVISSFLDIKKMEKIALSICNRYPIAFVHCRSYMSALAAVTLRKKKGLDFLFDMRGFWADERVDGKIWNLKHPLYKSIYKFFKKKEIEFLNTAKHTVSLTHNAKTEILQWENVKLKENDISVIPCCVNTDLFNPLEIVEKEIIATKEKLEIASSDFILGYVGSLGTWYMLPEMMALYANLRRSKQKPVFLFVSKEDPEYILSEAKKLNIPIEEIIVTSCLHHEVPLYMSIFDLSVFFILPAYSKKASSPVKQGELMAMGIPLICNAGVGDTDKIITEAGAGLVLKGTQAEHLKNLHLPEINRQEMMQYAKEKFSLKNGGLKYLLAYKKMMN
ncbi:Glycosyltransferase involved in cell wall bisynthesis [Lishizhenia tianjinensis]|uniref:Glycosyltransferase involved in cell wall bisynthesis n=1 Tax=Lishizhenia tianjinensis TaxID=477690 RepID=A0A1I6ZVF7_9FLAO|nr:glycosyltransferase [Lishizhenia tianjinensis]SFT66654.1 Glycosyltransferase involved in cell wall bisynthesis [Lishizhenia tianjinensis]